MIRGTQDLEPLQSKNPQTKFIRVQPPIRNLRVTGSLSSGEPPPQQVREKALQPPSVQVCFGLVLVPEQLPILCHLSVKPRALVQEQVFREQFQNKLFDLCLVYWFELCFSESFVRSFFNIIPTSLRKRSIGIAAGTELMETHHIAVSSSNLKFMEQAFMLGIPWASGFGQTVRTPRSRKVARIEASLSNSTYKGSIVPIKESTGTPLANYYLELLWWLR